MLEIEWNNIVFSECDQARTPLSFAERVRFRFLGVGAKVGARAGGM